MDINELRIEAEEVKERVKRDISELRDIMRRMADEVGEARVTRAETAMKQAEKRIEDTAQKVELRISQAISIMTGTSTGKGKVISREIDVADFSNIDISSCFKVEITRADSYSVTVSGEESLFDCINVEKSGSTLRISTKSLPFVTRPDLQAKITIPQLSKLRLGGASTCSISGFSSRDELDLNISGNSSLTIHVEAGKTRAEISGASRLRGKMALADAEFTLSGASWVELNGYANSAVLNAWGASRLDLAEFPIKNTDVNLRGASQASISVSKKLDLELSGGSRLCYTGNPTMGRINVSGASTLSQR